MVSAPASSPCLDSSFRSRRITSSVSASTACGLECGRRDRGSKGGNTLGVETFDQQLHPEPGNPVVPGHLTLGPALHSDRGNDQLSHRHVAPPKKRCQLCPETGAKGLSGKRCKWPNTLSCGLARKGRYDRNTGGGESTITKRSDGSAVSGGVGRGQGAGPPGPR